MAFRIFLLVLSALALAVLSQSGILPPVALLLIAGGGIVAGIAAGLFGIGGGIVLVPTLLYAFKLAGIPQTLTMHMALATSLAVIIPAGITAGWTQWKRGMVDAALFRTLAPGAFLGAILGAIAAHHIPGARLELLFSLFLFYVGLKMLFPRAAGSGGGQRKPFSYGFPLGVLIGGVSAIMGIGGGSLTVPVLTALGVSIHAAIATSSALGAVLSVPATASYILLGWGEAGLPPYSAGYVFLPALLTLTPLAVLLAPYGVALSHRLPAQHLRRGFGAFLLIVAVKMVI